MRITEIFKCILNAFYFNVSMFNNNVWFKIVVVFNSRIVKIDMNITEM